MKRNIRLILPVILSLLIVKFIIPDVNSPQSLIGKIGTLFSQKNFAFLFKSRKLNENVDFGTTVVKPIIKDVKASEKIVIYYKGKKLTIFTNDSNGEIPESSLEFFYQLELLRERNSKK